jgi:hypothetical protein
MSSIRAPDNTSRLGVEVNVALLDNRSEQAPAGSISDAER